jgi:hypothetical protein
MLLTDLSARAGRDDRESGSALAAVVGVIAVTAVIAMSLLASAAFGIGVTSAGTAKVQARAAAEAGLDYGHARWATCAGSGSAGTITVPSGTDPTFTLKVAYRKSAGDSWSNGCPRSDSTEVRIQATGYPEGVTPPSTGPRAVMEGVYSVIEAEPPRALFPNTVMGAHHIDIAAPATLTGSISTAGDFLCNATMSQDAAMTPTLTTLEPGDLHVGGDIVNNGSCATSGKVYDRGKYKPNDPRNVFPQIVPGDPRLSALTPTPIPLSQAIWQLDPYSAAHPCDISGYQIGPHPLPSIVIDARECSGPIASKPGHVPGPLRIRVDVTVELSGDMVWLVDDFDLSGNITVNSQPGTGTHSLYVIKPWGRGPDDSCATGAAKGIRMTGGGFITDANTKVMLYSSELVDVGTTLSMAGQIYGCDVRLGAPTQLLYGQFGTMTPAVSAGWRLVSKRDVTG